MGRICAHGIVLKQQSNSTMTTLLLSFAVALCVAGASANGIIGCYYGQWANERPGLGNFGVSDLPLNLCTHIYYAFVDITSDGNITLPLENEIDGKANYISDFIALKESNADLKLILSIGGWNAGSTNFSTVVNDDTIRATFVDNIVNFLVERGFDGLDVDWEYPAQRGGLDTDKEAFVYLLRDLKAQFSGLGLELSCAVAVTQSNIDISYDVVNITKYASYVNLMTYDYHGTWETVSGVNAPLYPQLTDDPDSVLNVNASVNVWIDNGAPPSKLVMGLGAYGHSFTLTSQADVSTGAPVTGGGTAGPYTEASGTLAYYEICLSQQETAWNITQVDDSYVYANSGDQWVGYDNANTIYAKAQYAKAKGLAGVMFWAADLDDFGGQCGKTYPLIKAARKGFLGVTSKQSSMV